VENGAKSSSRPPAAAGWSARFGVFEADLASGELRKNGLRVHLPSQPFQILAHLLQHPGEVVTREQLRDALWPGDTHVDFDRCLNTAINRLRETLNDSADNPCFIQTLPRRGYRFVAPVQACEVPGPEAAIPAPASQPRSRISRRMVLVAAALGAAALAAWYLGVGSRPGGPPVAVGFSELGGNEITPAFSPGGEHVVFAWNGVAGNHHDLYIKGIGETALTHLTEGPAEDFGPSYLPDGTLIAFYRRSGDRAGIYTVSPQSKEVTRLAGLNIGPPGPSADAPQTGLETVSWSPDGKFVAYVDKASPAEPFSIFLFALARREQERLTWPPASASDRLPVFAPDGRSLAFVREQGGGSEIHVLSLERGQSRRLTAAGGRISGLAWTGEGQHILFGSGRGEDTYIWRVAAAGGAAERVTQVRESGAYPAVPARGRGLAFVRPARKSYIWMASTGAPDPALPAGRLEALHGAVATPRISPDGNRIAFSWEVAGRREIWASDSGGIKPVCLTSLGSHSASPSWSPDGRWIAFDSIARGNWDVFVVGAGGGPPRAVANQAGEDVRPRWSADGRWIYFGSDRTGTMQIWKAPLEGGEPRQVTRNGGYEAVESPDGKFVYYTRRGVAGLWRTPAAGGPEILFVPDLQWENSRNWDLAGGDLYYLSGGSQGATLNFLDLRTSRGRTLAPVDSAFIANSGISLSPDRKWFAYVRQDERETDIALLAGFR